MASTPHFSGTVILDPHAQWYITMTLRGGGLDGELVQGSQDQVLAWARKKYGNSIVVPGTNLNVDPFSSAGFGGGATTIVTGPYATKQDAINAAETGAYTNLQTTNQNPVSGWVHNVEQWLVRGFEMLLGIGLIIVALAKLAGNTSAGRAATKAGKAAAIL